MQAALLIVTPAHLGIKQHVPHLRQVLFQLNDMGRFAVPRNRKIHRIGSAFDDSFIELRTGSIGRYLEQFVKIDPIPFLNFWRPGPGEIEDMAAIFLI